MKRFLLLSVFAIGVLAAVAGVAIFNHLNNPKTTVHAQEYGTEQRGRPPLPGFPGNGNGNGQGNNPNAPSAVGAWWGIARPCPADPSTDAAHIDLCNKICDKCGFIPGTLPPEVPMMPSINGDGTVTVNDAGSIAVFHTTAQGAWAADPTDPVQIAGRIRYQASFVWLQGSPDQISGSNDNRAFVGVARPRFVTFFDPNNPDSMQGYIQPHFFPIVDPKTGFVIVQPANVAGQFEGSHLPVLNFLAPLPQGCQNDKGCLGTYHFTIHRIKTNVPN